MLILNFLSFHLSENLFHSHYGKCFQLIIEFSALKHVLLYSASFFCWKVSCYVYYCFLHVMFLLSYSHLKIFVLYFAFWTMVCLGMLCLLLIMLGFCWPSWMCILVFFIKLGDIEDIISSEMCYPSSLSFLLLTYLEIHYLYIRLCEISPRMTDLWSIIF